MTSVHGQDQKLYSSAVDFLKKEIIKKSELKSFFKKEIDRKTKLCEFQISDTVFFQNPGFFEEELSHLNKDDVENFDSYNVDFFKSDGNGLVLSFSRPINEKYLLAELTTVEFSRITKMRLGKLARLLFEFDESGNVIGFYSKLYNYN